MSNEAERYNELLQTSLSMKSRIFWDVTLCSVVEVCRHFRGMSINVYQTISCHIPDACILHSHHCENFKSNTVYAGKKNKMLRLLPLRVSLLCTIQGSEKSQLTHKHTLITLKFTTVVSCVVLAMQNIQTSWFITICKWHYLCTYNFIYTKNRITNITQT
jgi:hypothetical protein